MTKKFILEKSYGPDPEFEYLKGTPAPVLVVTPLLQPYQRIEFQYDTVHMNSSRRVPTPVVVEGKVRQYEYYRRLWERYWRFVAHVLSKRSAVKE